MPRTICCGDIVEGCQYTAEAASETELLSKVSKHAHDAHGVVDVTPELAAKVKSAIKER